MAARSDMALNVSTAATAHSALNSATAADNDDDEASETNESRAIQMCILGARIGGGLCGARLDLGLGLGGHRAGGLCDDQSKSLNEAK